jgi:hypothetical protein
MKKKYILLKIPAGSPAPPGYTFARTLPRQGLDVYQKEIPQAPAVAPQKMADLEAMMAGMGLGPNAAQIIEADDGGLAAALAGLALQGGRKKRKTRRTKRSKRNSRRVRK